MTTPQQVKQALQLALSLSEGLSSFAQAEAQEVFEILGEINKSISKASNPTPNQAVQKVASDSKKTLKHPIDTLLKKGKVKLSDKRYYHLTEIYDELTTVLKVEFLSAKQNQDATWFPLERQGDKSAALFLHAGEWSIAPLSQKANGELSGIWEDFDLGTQMQSNRPEVDLDDY